MSEKKWLDTGFLRAKPQEVSAKTGVIKGVKVCSEGPAKGHGVSLDSDFIGEVTKQGNALKSGLKARFGHPNMCSESLGTFIGRFKNFSTGTTKREDGTEASCCFADLHLSETAKDTPNGDLYAYVLAMAENEADVFGTSIVFHRGEEYRKNEQGEKVFPYDRNGNRNQEYREAGGPIFIECEKLCACDCVDEPAANDGLFSSSAFSGETIAGQITQFLDLHPQIFQALSDNPEILEAVAQYGDKFDEFLTRYREHRNHNHKSDQEGYTMPDKKDEVKEETPETKEELQEVTPKTESAKGELSVDEAVQKALAEDRQRSGDIRELGAKFGFAEDAEQFARDGKSVDDFRTHILNKSPEAWEASLSIKNPATQQSEKEVEQYEEGNSVVAQIKEKRRA